MIHFRSRFASVGLALVAAFFQLSACSAPDRDYGPAAGGTLSQGGHSAGGAKPTGVGGAIFVNAGGRTGSTGGESSAGAGGEVIAEGGAPAGGSPAGGAPAGGEAGGPIGAAGAGGNSSTGGSASTGGTLGSMGGTGSGGAVCGNSRIEPPETCDDGNAVTDPCPYGEMGCKVCGDTCVTALGVTSYCGDTKIDARNEECDDGDSITNPCAYGLMSCTVCDAACRKAQGATSYCGDGVVDMANGEACDDKNTVTERCAYGLSSCTVCDARCQTAMGATSVCGDGMLDTANGEVCDDKNASNVDTCSTACKTCGYVPGLALPTTLSGYANSGIQFTALTNSTLTQFFFNNQGKADTISLTRLSDNRVLYSIAVAATNVTGKTTMNVAWSLDANIAYGLSNADGTNGFWASAPAGTYPAAGSGGIIRVDKLYGGGTFLTEYWFTFTDLHACAR